MTLRTDLAAAINRHSAENGSNTPDFILAEYLNDCLAAFDRAMRARQGWYGSNADALDTLLEAAPAKDAPRCGRCGGSGQVVAGYGMLNCPACAPAPAKDGEARGPRRQRCLCREWDIAEPHFEERGDDGRVHRLHGPPCDALAATEVCPRCEVGLGHEGYPCPSPATGETVPHYDTLEIAQPETHLILGADGVVRTWAERVADVERGGK